MKITSIGMFSFGSEVGSWYNKNQRSVELISAEEEYMVASQETCEAIWMRKMLIGFLVRRWILQ